MKIKEAEFRAIYKHFVLMDLSEQLNHFVDGFPDSDKANCLLAYGYVDHTAGLTLEVVAAGEKTTEGITFFDASEGISSKIRLGEVQEEVVYWLPNYEENLQGRYSEKLKTLAIYEESEELVQSRDMQFLDNSRDPIYVDDVLVYLTKDGLEPEGCWTRIEHLGEHALIGVLLNEPQQDFGYHKGETIGFFVHQLSDGSHVCVCDMNPSRKLSREDLEDGTMLEQAIVSFNQNRTNDGFIDILELLRDSEVWVPCVAVFSDRDQAMIEQAVAQESDENQLIGKEFVSQDEVRLVPDILRNGNDYFFPAFTHAEAMGEYGEEMSKVKYSFLDVIRLAMNNAKEVVGIVLNPFTDSFVLPKDLFDMVSTMKSRIV